MSDQVAEPQEPVIEPDEQPDSPVPDEQPEQPEPVEQPEPIEGPGDDDSEPSEPSEQPIEGGPEPGVAEAALLSERELEKRLGRIDAENGRHRKRLGEIMEEDALHLVPCPVCMDGFHGWIFDPAHVPLSEEQRERTLQLLNLADFEDIPQASWAQTCQTCNGHGRIKTGSKKEGREFTDCLDCGGSGWHNLHERQRANGNGDTHEFVVTGPTVYGGDDPDPRVQSLKEEGWMVVPPTTLPSVAS